MNIIKYFANMSDRGIVFLLTILSSIFYIGISSLPGGLHWENYDLSFATQYAQKYDYFFWKQDYWAYLGLYDIYTDLLYWITGSRGTFTIVLGSCLFASLILIVTYILARQLMDKRGAIIASFFVLFSPSLFLQSRSAGFMIGVGNCLAGTIVVLSFILFQKYNRKISAILFGAALSISYLSTYVSFPFLLYSFGAAIIIKIISDNMRKDEIIRYIWVTISFCVITYVSSGLISKLYLKQDSLFIIRSTEQIGGGLLNAISPILGEGAPKFKSQAFKQQISITNAYNNTKNMLLDQFSGAVSNYKSYTPINRKPMVWPFDHLGAVLPGVPAIYALVGILAIIGIIPIIRKKNFCEITILMLILVPVFVIGVFLSYQGRRMLFILPYVCIVASIGYCWLEDKINDISSKLSLVVRYTMITIIMLMYLYHIGFLWPRYVSTLQFNHYTRTAEYIKNNYNPSKDVLVATDKSVFFPGAFYSELNTNYQFVYLSEMYFPVIIYQDKYDHGNYGPWSNTLNDYKEMIAYCNMGFPDVDFGIHPNISKIARLNISSVLTQLNAKGYKLHFMISGSSDNVRESGGLFLDRFILREVIESGYKLSQEWISDTNYNLVIFNLEIPKPN